MVRIILIRHTEVAQQWRGRCYGQSDVGLSAAGRKAAHEIALEIDPADMPLIVSSPLRRARFLGGLIARRSAAALHIEPRLSECHFGTWEGRQWEEIYAQTGNAMIGLVTAPSDFRPGGGETTFELRDRAMSWLESFKPRDGLVIAVAHGGPIAAIRGTLSGASVRDWPSLAPAYGAQTEIIL